MAPVAQPGRARASGARGPGFKSRRGRHAPSSNFLSSITLTHLTCLRSLAVTTELLTSSTIKPSIGCTRHISNVQLRVTSELDFQSSSVQFSNASQRKSLLKRLTRAPRRHLGRSLIEEANRGWPSGVRGRGSSLRLLERSRGGASASRRIVGAGLELLKAREHRCGHL